ncbi:hypothetical protein [Weissella thailandensis]|uniref:ABC transmembrane type-1 domain-containing protein n=1 Tax=Weissella thailandensis TaxID=89061 RepID=A0ABX9I6X2_9LACO|nr:hypothetical protein [Weissella thailandensis]NKY90336.1 hypothetical protein [Weissella thailandensis]RDS60436.1 hypothetical protein DWV05_00600 [Weissella thailandensis]GEP75682.1 hypothetical protein WTH01_19290 [Weissella thailandensis]
MLAEVAMFIQLLGMATLAAILPTIIVMGAIYLAYTYRAQLLDILQGILRIICWLIICLVDGKAKADGIKVKKI